MASEKRRLQLTRTQRCLMGTVVAGAVLIAAIGFAGSYSAVRDLAEKKGFGQFSIVFPIGIDAGICVLLALDLLLTWMRIPFPLLRQTAWLLTAATIAFNGAAAWPDPLGVGMHAVIPILFVVSVEAARHAVGRIADITADKHMEGVRLTRWLLSPVPTFKLWRRMKLWEIRSYEDIIQLEQDRLIYQARLQARYGRNWRRKAPIEAMMPLRLAKYGVPLADTGPAGLAAAGIEPALLPPAQATAIEPASAQAGGQAAAQASAPELPQSRQERELTEEEWIQLQKEEQWARENQQQDMGAPAAQENPWFAAPRAPEGPYQGSYDPDFDPQRYEQQQYEQQSYEQYEQAQQRYEQYEAEQYETEQPRAEQRQPQQQTAQQTQQAQQFPPRRPLGPQPAVDFEPEPEPEEPPTATLPEGVPREEAYFNAFQRYVKERGDMPNGRQLAVYLQDLYGVTGRTGGPLSESSLRAYVKDFRRRYQEQLDAQDSEHIA
ncbi:DUF2637 domain-containing protein [Streptomyces sp. NP-1717]|uniref:DUF2637 domain-containing protein n=1 Tax=Streptomyces sp. NP-1717 TaxID=2704470 RepID=UPI001F5D7C7F|nr:DUF2637 domain-containing protein [Streptomyces sp. NP-1717]MCI3222006.1 DUF2637 domain-containing protein [Streptomyces sp. NP-1717]